MFSDSTGPPSRSRFSFPWQQPCWRGERRFFLLGVLWVSAIAAVLLSISYSAKLAFIVIVLALPISIALPRIVHRLTMATLPLTVLAMPWIASIANSLIPTRIHEAVGYGSLTIRGEIWQETVPFHLAEAGFRMGRRGLARAFRTSRRRHISHRCSAIC